LTYPIFQRIFGLGGDYIMAKLRNIILGTVAVVAVGAGLTYGWQQRPIAK
jgi:hypothetical protein